MPQSQVHSAFERMLLSAERLIAIVEDLVLDLRFVPHVIPGGNYTAQVPAALAMTSHRVIALWAETAYSWKWLHIPALNSVSERSLRSDKPSWLYQAIMFVPGGIAVVVQTRQRNPEHAKQLSSLLNEAIVRPVTSRDDIGAMAAIIAHEEEKKDGDASKKKHVGEKDRTPFLACLRLDDVCCQRSQSLDMSVFSFIIDTVFMFRLPSPLAAESRVVAICDPDGRQQRV